MKIDSKSLIFGILTGIAIGSVVSFVLVESLPFGLTTTEQYTVTIRIVNTSRITLNYSIWVQGAIAVFSRDNTTIGEYHIWYSPAVNITLQKGAYTVKIYDGKSGIFIEEKQIYVAKDIEVNIYQS
jgi:uncharacterized membrane protein